MMELRKIAIVGKDISKIDLMKEKLLYRGFEFVEENPDLVISYGGDGMFLIAERIFSGVPKILIRDSDVGNMAYDLDVCDVLDLYLEGRYEVEEIKKLKGTHRGRFEFRSLMGVNDIVLRNSLPTEAIRFRYRVNSGDWSDVLIGDGLVVSTSYGSNKGAYFYSIVGKSFESGIGVAFNNVTGDIEHLYLKSSDKFEIEIVRGIGVMVTDNNRDFINLESGDKIVIGEIEDVAKRIILRK
ncbi:hypothetical protein KAS08_04530 [Candidatus Pacearchaeota archaeon]|nr:hypothetical protein [Candidatus Pacearchaeota archaeon]